ncbi:DUF2284 domain-containing protein [Guggenheimella bovis]
MIEVRQTEVSELLQETYDPERVYGFCSSCERYGKHFACPTRNQGVLDYVSRFQTAWIFFHTIIDHKSFGESITTRFFHYRDQVDPILRSFETDSIQSVLAGPCRYCSTSCETENLKACRHPESLRYSFESMGFDVAKMTEFYIDKKLTFEPKKHILVYGFLSNESLDVKPIIERLERIEDQ